jgi:hypothetical protein
MINRSLNTDEIKEFEKRLEHAKLSLSEEQKL